MCKSRTSVHLGKFPVVRRTLSELLYDWRFTANPFVLATSPLRPTTSNFICELNNCGCSLYVTSSLTRGIFYRLQLLLVLARAVIIGSESRGTHCHILLPQIRDSPNLEGPGLRIYIPQEEGGPVIPPGTWFLFRRLLRLARLWWRYSTPPPKQGSPRRTLFCRRCNFKESSRRTQ
jgi:hypothetical protein